MSQMTQKEESINSSVYSHQHVEPYNFKKFKKNFFTIDESRWWQSPKMQYCQFSGKRLLSLLAY